MSELVPSVENLYRGAATLRFTPAGVGPGDRARGLPTATFHRDR